MSLDFPFYEELCRRNHPAAKWWRLGDTLYYVGLVPAMILAVPALVSLVGLIFKVSMWQLWTIVLFLSFAAVFVLGARLKLKSWRMAAKDGINVDNY